MQNQLPTFSCLCPCAGRDDGGAARQPAFLLQTPPEKGVTLLWWSAARAPQDDGSILSHVTALGAAESILHHDGTAFVCFLAWLLCYCPTELGVMKSYTALGSRAPGQQWGQHGRCWAEICTQPWLLRASQEPGV